MKTLLFKSADGSNQAEVKVDIFASNTDLVTAGFETRFTHMEIIRDEAALIAGINMQEIEQSWQGLITLAVNKGYTLTVLDLKESAPQNVVTATALAGTLAGTKGASAITGTTTNFDPELDVDDVIYVDGFTYTVATRADDTNATINETFNTTFSGETAYVIAKV